MLFLHTEDNSKVKYKYNRKVTVVSFANMLLAKESSWYINSNHTIDENYIQLM